MLLVIQTGAATIENSMEGLQNIKNETALWRRHSPSGYIYKETQNTNSKQYMHPYVHCSIIYNSQVPINIQVDKKWWYKYTMEYYSAIKKNEILAFMTAWVNLEGIMLSEINKIEKCKYHISFTLYVKSKE